MKTKTKEIIGVIAAIISLAIALGFFILAIKLYFFGG